MKLVFLFMSKSSAVPNSTERVYPQTACGKYYSDAFNDEGYFKMVEILLEKKVFSEVYVFYESNREPGLAGWIKSHMAYCEVIPEIRFVDEYIDDDTVILVRGGFKHWHNFLLKYKDINWLLIYAANTGRDKWKFWDVVFDDLEMKNEIDKYGRYYFPFVKPINEDIFIPLYKQERHCDFCVGASHIHDKKGQWRIVEAVKEYNKIYLSTLNCIMPGSPRGGAKTKEMFNKLSETKFVTTPGFVDRKILNKIYNMSKYYIHFGAHGQNDRSAIEALCAGVFPIITHPKYHTPYLSKLFSRINIDFKFTNLDNPVEIAKDLRRLRNEIYRSPISSKEFIENLYQKYNGMHTVVIPRMKKLFEIISENKTPTPEAKEQLRLEMSNEVFRIDL